MQKALVFLLCIMIMIGLASWVIFENSPNNMVHSATLAPTPAPTPSILPQAIPLTVSIYTQGNAIGTITLSPVPNAGGSGVISAAGAYQTYTTTVYYWSPVNVTLTASSNFLEWSGALTGTTNPAVLYVDRVYSVKASFQDVAPPTPTPPPPTGSIKIQFYNQNTASTNNQLYLNFKVINTGSNPVALSTVKIRYYYTKDDAQAQNFYCDYSPAGNSNVTGAFVMASPAKTGADTYLEVGFLSDAGVLAAGGGYTTVQTRVAKSDWSNYTQNNDYSFNPNATNYMDWTKVTGYVSGVLQWGTEP